MHSVNELCYILITNLITLKQSLAQSLNLIFKFTSIKRKINIPLWTHMGHKWWRKMEKCYTIPLKFGNEFNANFLWLYFSSYRSIKIWHIYLKNVQTNNKAVHLMLLFTYLHQNLINIKNDFALVLLPRNRKPLFFILLLFLIFSVQCKIELHNSHIMQYKETNKYAWNNLHLSQIDLLSWVY